MKQKPFVPGGRAPGEPQALEGEETMVLQGTKYNLFVISDQDKLPAGWRLRPVPIDPHTDYSNLLEDFDPMDSERYGKPAFEACMEKFNEGNAEFSAIIEQVKRRSGGY